ncbi:MAG: sialate O-acetylesterase [Planctomycetes bacterium]|nr:sialate O-acetylesterase [Planctomycetota bacterium]
MKRLAPLAALFLFPATLHAQPLKVFVLAGQSNMQGHARVTTFEHIGMDSATAPMLADMQNADGSPKVVDRVWISSIGCAEHEQTGPLTVGFGASNNGPKIGPEYTFGIQMRKSTDGPILLIKTSWGGKSLHTDFRPPSAGPYPFNAVELANYRKQGKDVESLRAERAKQTGVHYRLMVEHVKAVLADIPRVVPDYDAAQGYELAGFVWFQGWNDMVDGGVYPHRDQPGGYDAYGDVLGHFIRDVRKDLGAPNLPFVIGVLGVGGPTSEYGPDQQRYKATHQHFRDAMAAPALRPEFAGTVIAVRTEVYWDRELTAVKAKEEGLRRKAKSLAAESRRNAAEEHAIFEKLRGEELTDRERKILDVAISNQAYHYLGSAKILGRIGMAFAEAIVELEKSKPR